MDSFFGFAEWPRLCLGCFVGEVGADADFLFPNFFPLPPFNIKNVFRFSFSSPGDFSPSNSLISSSPSDSVVFLVNECDRESVWELDLELTRLCVDGEIHEFDNEDGEVGEGEQRVSMVMVSGILEASLR